LTKFYTIKTYALIFTNTQTADRVMKKYPVDWRHKAHVIPHGYDSADRVRHAPAAVSGGKLTIVHTGRFYEGIRTPEPLLHALASLAARRALDDELRVALVGTVVPAHQRLATELGLGHVVEFAGRVPFAESSRRAAQADVLMVIDAPADESLFLPSKLIDYLPFEKPILALTPARGASADLIRRLGYPIVPPDDVQAIEAAIENLLKAKREGRLRPAGCHRSIAESYDVRRTTATLAEILARCA